MSNYKSPLHETVTTSATDLWNDSCSQEELRYAIEHGASGATSNPSIVTGVLKKELLLWKDRILAWIAESPAATEVDIAWKLNEEMAVAGGSLLQPIFAATRGKKGRISIQTNGQYYRSAKLLTEQALHFDTLAANIMVKIPATQAGITAIEESTYRGVNINATVCFTVAQALAVAEAVERGLRRRESEGKENDHLTPVCTIMVGRLDDWLKIVTDRQGLVPNPEILEWAGVAAMKRAYGIYRERGYRCRLLAAAYRNHYHWSEFIGGDIVLTIPHKWQQRFNQSKVRVEERMSKAVEPAIVRELQDLYPDFVRAYEPGGMNAEEFDDFGATRRTLRTFIADYSKLLSLVRDFMISDPDA